MKLKLINFLMDAVAKLPYRWLLSGGKWLGRGLYYVSSYRRHIVETNIRLCFSRYTVQQQKKLCQKTFESMGMGIVEALFAWHADSDKLAQLRFDIHGDTYLKAALADGKGAILIGIHFTTLEIIGQLFAQRQALAMVYREQKTDLFDNIVLQGRQRFEAQAIQRHDIRGMLKALKKNIPLWYAPDQDYGEDASVFVPFFGIPAATVAGTFKLAKMSKSPIILTSYYRKPDLSGYDLFFHPPMQLTDDLIANSAKLNKDIEAAILKHPEQYLWSHRRFKSSPDARPSFYANKPRRNRA